ncbi:hypothetical protein CHS0354_029037 [Potamilus streckersoni]|uniref:Uncharacterized protein n=1 Tax=Potamilus streckersoni TaxID=2493646 RepID=A0AAE0SGC1_9BIVA|nr:hypothetical protein CHS0354_029037 [Potamilus streckersoni]
MDLHIQFNIAMILAAVLGEMISFFFYNHHSSWGNRIGERYLFAAIISDAGLVVLLKLIMEQYWSVGRWEDAAILSLWLSLLFACLEAPHVVHNHNSFTHFFFHTLHKFSIMFVMICVLVYFRHY